MSKKQRKKPSKELNFKWQLSDASSEEGERITQEDVQIFKPKASRPKSKFHDLAKMAKEVRMTRLSSSTFKAQFDKQMLA